MLCKIVYRLIGIDERGKLDLAIDTLMNGFPGVPIVPVNLLVIVD